MTTSIIITPDESLAVHSTDPAIPVAIIDQGHAVCPRCAARIDLPALRHDGRPHGDEFALHYVHEHVLPEIRYEETSE